MSRFAITTLVLAVSLLCDSLPCIGQAPEKKPVPKFTGTELPTPPQQTAEWKIPETTLPINLVSATKILFDQGLADPRGCEYRAIEIGVRGVWGQETIVETHGWALPAEKDGQRFAVCWNGLVYPVISVGEIADLQADAEAMNEAERHLRADFEKKHPDRKYQISFRQLEEATSVDHTNWRVPIKICFLLRLGETDLAEESWRLWDEGIERNVNDQTKHTDDPYYLFSQGWIWSLFDRAICAHMQGDHGLSLASCEKLLQVADAIRETVKARGFNKGFRGEISNLPFVFLEPLPALLEDQRRRVKQEPYQTVIEKGLETYDGSKDDLIAALIRDLETVSARQWGQPGGVSLPEDPVVTALIAQGADAVEPLIDCIATDTRLTRSVGFSRDFSSHRELKGVDEAAYAAISEILETRTIPRPHPVLVASDKVMEYKKGVANEIREYWNKVKDTPLTQRWYDALADDEATDKWYEAANLITRPTSFKTKDGTMRGEPLRDISDPSVTELMAKRVRQLTLKDKASSSTEMFRMHKACSLALILAIWDLDGALPTLREQMNDSRRSFLEVKTYGSTAAVLGTHIAKFTLKRVEAGDEAALDEYAAWVRDVTPQQLEHYASAALEPLWTHPTHPAIADVSDKIFNGESSPWNPILTAEKRPNEVSMLDLLRTPLLKNAAFRQQILRGLTDTTVAGYVTITGPENIQIELAMGRHMGRMVSPKPNDPPLPPVGTKLPVRLCDYYAHELQRQKGPTFGVYWPEAERDKAVAACVEFVTNYKPDDAE